MKLKKIKYEGKASLFVTLKAAHLELMGEVVVVGAVVRKKPEKIPLVSPPKKDSTLSKFSVFPNPVEHNSVFTIETKDMEDGRYYLAIIATAGEVLQTEELIIDNKLKRLTIQLKNLSAAPYFIRLTNKTNNRSYTEIILVK